MNANPILLKKKYSRVIECFAEQKGISLDAALDFFHCAEYTDGCFGGWDIQCFGQAIPLYNALSVQIFSLDELIFNCIYTRFVIPLLF